MAQAGRKFERLILVLIPLIPACSAISCFYSPGNTQCECCSWEMYIMGITDLMNAQDILGGLRCKQQRAPRRDEDIEDFRELERTGVP